MDIFKIVVDSMNLVEDIEASSNKKEHAINIINSHIDKMDLTDENKRDIKQAVPFIIETVIYVGKHKKEIKVNTKKCWNKLSCV